MPTIQLLEEKHANIRTSNKAIFATFSNIVEEHVLDFYGAKQWDKIKAGLLLQLTKEILKGLPNEVTPSNITIGFAKNVSDSYITLNFLPANKELGAFITVTLFLCGTSHVKFSNGAFDWSIKTVNQIRLEPMPKQNPNQQDFWHYELIQLENLLANIPSFLEGNYAINMLAKTPRQIARDNKFNKILVGKGAINV